jgi:hypothetical protein
MERRCSKRIIVSLKAELISDGVNYAGFIENLSENGLFVTTTPTKTTIVFTPEAPCAIKFQLPSGETLNLPCKIIWAYRTPPHGITNSIGLEIIDQHQKYIEFLKTF